MFFLLYSLFWAFPLLLSSFFFPPSSFFSFRFLSFRFLLVSPFLSSLLGIYVFFNGAKLRKNVDTKSSRAYLFYIKVRTAAVY